MYVNAADLTPRLGDRGAADQHGIFTIPSWNCR